MKKAKKILSLVLIVLTISLIFIIYASAETIWSGIYVVSDDDFAYEIIGGETIIRGYRGSESKIYIPSEIEGYPVTTIGVGAFQHRTGITEVTIPNTVTAIENDAFYGCSDLCKINISENISYMGYTVFQGTQWYNSFQAGDLIYIGNVLYEFKTTINGKYEEPTELIIREGTKCIAGDALRYLTKTVEITIPDSVEFIGQSAFNEIESLKIVNMGKGVKTISDYAFVNNDIVTINYNASKLHWNNIKIGVKNEPLLNANIIFNDNGHRTIDTTIENPTCTIDGYTSYMCECGESFICDIVGAKGHSYISVVTKPTCSSRGYTTYTCACGDSYTTDYIDVLHHNYSSSITKIPTHLTMGRKTYTCTLCRDEYTEDIAKLTQHTYNVLSVVAPTCTDKGYTIYACACGEKYTDDYTESKGHNYENSKCVVCGKDCSCDCHAEGIKAFFFKIINFFEKIFGKNKVCACGAKH